MEKLIKSFAEIHPVHISLIRYYRENKSYISWFKDFHEKAYKDAVNKVWFEKRIKLNTEVKRKSEKLLKGNQVLTEEDSDLFSEVFCLTIGEKMCLRKLIRFSKCRNVSEDRDFKPNIFFYDSDQEFFRDCFFSNEFSYDGVAIELDRVRKEDPARNNTKPRTKALIRNIIYGKSHPSFSVAKDLLKVFEILKKDDKSYNEKILRYLEKMIIINSPRNKNNNALRIQCKQQKDMIASAAFIYKGDPATLHKYYFTNIIREVIRVMNPHKDDLLACINNYLVPLSKPPLRSEYVEKEITESIQYLLENNEISIYKSRFICSNQEKTSVEYVAREFKCDVNNTIDNKAVMGSILIREHVNELLKIASQALTGVPKRDRLMKTMTISLPQNRYQMVVEVINNCIDQINQIVRKDLDDNEKLENIYTAIFSLVPLKKSNWKMEWQ